MNLRSSVVSSAIYFALAIPGFAVTISVGTPNTFGTGLTPSFGTLVNFDNLAPLSAVSPTAYSSAGIASLVNGPASEPLLALPNSTQSPPNYITTGASDSYAGNITLTFTNLTSQAGFGISGDGMTPVTLTAYGASGNVLGSFTEIVPSTTYNAYYVLADTAFDIKSVSLTAAQNLAIDDVQFSVVPEPTTFALAAVSIAALSLRRMRNRRA